LGLVGADFRHFLAKRQIPADALNIEQIFVSFCAPERGELTPFLKPRM
jgi:hypothetical protein